MKPGTLGIVLVLFTGLNVFLTMNRHSHAPKHTYHGELWADRAGYYVYLPATFVHGFDARRFESGLDTLTGGGFTLDTLNGRVGTKYTCGVALLQAPFYLIGHGIAALIGKDDEPYGLIDHMIVDVASPVYLSLGLLLLFLLLRKRHGDTMTGWVLLAIYAGSNLFYYTIGDPGMSHVYSFFLFATLLYLWVQLAKNGGTAKRVMTIGVIAGLIILVRPTNLTFVLLAPICAASLAKIRVADLIDHLRYREILVLIVSALAAWLPQFIYWQHAYGSWITWPYAGEGFTNWSEPKLMEFWFAPNNGLFTYDPIYALALLGAIASWRQERSIEGIVAWVAFLVISYLGASWWVWHFGCGFGSRTMVEYTALFVIPLADWVSHTKRKHGAWLPAICLVLFVVVNIKLVYSYGNCWFHSTWDWQAYGDLLLGPTK